MAAKQKPRKQLDSLKWLESAAATKDSRPVLTAGYISNGAACAADGFRLHVVWGFKHRDNWITFKKTARDATNGRFPDVWAVIPPQNTETETAIVSVSELTQAVSIARVFAKASDDKVTLTFMSGRVYVTGSDPIDGNAQTAIQALTNRPNDLRSDFAVKGEYLIDALAGFSGHVTLRLYGNSRDVLTLGEHGDRLALLMPMIERDPKIDTRPVIDEALEARPFEPGFSVKPPAAPKVKPAKVAKAEVTETVTTDDAGMVHERIEIRRGAAAFADVKPRLTPEKIAEFQRVEALQAAEAAAV